MSNVEMEDGRMTADTSTPQESQLQRLSNVKCHQTPDDLGWCDQSRGTALCGPVPDESDYATEFEGTWESTARGLTRSFWTMDEKENRKHGLFEVVDEKE